MTDGHISEPQLAVVTGAASGIGAALCSALVKRGVQVVAADGAPIADSDNSQLIAVECDVTDPSDVDRLFDRVRAEGRPASMVFNNAGINQRVFAPVHELPVEEWERVFDVNARGAFLILRRAARDLLEVGQPGAIVNTSSMGALRAVAGTAAYVASKAAIVMLTKAAALDYAQAGIRVNAICPGAIDTAMSRGLGEERRAAAEARIPMGRMGTPEEVAELAIFLASPEASFITGSAYVIDGGRNAM